MASKYTGRCSKSLIIKETQSKTTISSYTCYNGYYQKKETSVEENIKKLESLWTVNGSIKWYNCYGKQYGGSSKIELPYDSVIPLLAIYYQ